MRWKITSKIRSNNLQRHFDQRLSGTGWIMEFQFNDQLVLTKCPLLKTECLSPCKTTIYFVFFDFPIVILCFRFLCDRFIVGNIKNWLCCVGYDFLFLDRPIKSIDGAKQVVMKEIKKKISTKKADNEIIISPKSRRWFVFVVHIATVKCKGLVQLCWIALTIVAKCNEVSNRMHFK